MPFRTPALRYLLPLTFCFLLSTTASAQLKPRPDAFPPEEAAQECKAVVMADDMSQMADWDRYPTYSTYLDMMRQWTLDFPDLCEVDTIGTSVQGRLILAMHIVGDRNSGLDKPQFFYSSTIHGDEVTGYVMMLRLIDTLLRGYGTNAEYTQLVDGVDIYINPLANPDGTYIAGDHTVRRATRYNANGVDLNRNYPDPFASTKSPLEQENEAMIAYFGSHAFRLSANLHGGSEVMNYPWDSFSSQENPHPHSNWWQEVCKRFVDTSRIYSPSHFRDVTSSGYVAGGDWYVISGGRQDYVNYYHNCLELTMELSTVKTIGSNELPAYWDFLQHSLVNYMAEILHLPGAEVPDSTDVSIPVEEAEAARVLVRNRSIVVEGMRPAQLEVYDITGRRVANRALVPGVYLVRVGEASVRKVVVL